MERVARRARSMLLAAVAITALMPLFPSAGASHGERCTTSCGNISIPYPFGVEPGCYHDDGFNLTCDHAHQPPKLFLGDGTVQVLDISIPNGTVRINSSRLEFWLGAQGANGTWRASGEGTNGTWHAGSAGYAAGPYFLVEDQNNLVAFACDVRAVLLREKNTVVSTCAPFCPKDDDGSTMVGNGACNGVGCCQASIVEGRASYRIQLHHLDSVPSEKTDASLYIAEQDYVFNMDYFYQDPPTMVPAVLGWTITSSACHSNGSSPSCLSKNSFCQNYSSYFDIPHPGHNCLCSHGYQGNPYISYGCYDINECDHSDTYPCYGDCKNTQGGYGCECPPGFKGNASEKNGCEDIDECKHSEVYPCSDGKCINMPGTFHCRCHDGTYWDPLMKHGCVRKKKSFTGLSIALVIIGGTISLLLALAAPFIARKIKLNRRNKQKERLFKQNHGLLLQQLVSQKRDFGERMIIPLSDLEKATNNFDKTREVGGGGHGVVYKGLLDLEVVAIKKSKIVVQREIDDFINEVVILSQINHRNVVKLIGCCLEAEVPLLVYEFISNGTLHQHLHVEGPVSIPWNSRIRIALEVARAISYLHSAASMPIYHRDIKSSNILLDDNFTAKVSDFGASRYIPIDQTGVTTAVQGTIGYLDPMYYYTGRLTDKSDVFSFGVLLIELLTRKKPCVFRCGGGVGLVSHFTSLRAEGDLSEIIDTQVMEEEDGEVQEVATLAAMCTKLKEEDRPTMREVEMTIENLRVSKRHAPRDTASRRHDRDEIEAHYMSMEGVAKEASRQYTMEDEILMSARYPR